MARKPLTKAQSKKVYLCWMFIFIFITVLIPTNFVISSIFGISVQFGPPDHDSPLSCSKRGFLQCTTRDGKCTKRKGKCVYPDQDYQCLHSIFKKQLTSSKVKQITAKYPNQAISLQKIKVLEQYCANDRIRLYKHMSEDLSPTMLNFELLVSSILFGIFQTELTDISHKIAYNQ